MKLQLRDLATHLKRPLSPLYWVSGDDVFLVNQAVKDITSAARAQGFEIERESISSSVTFSVDRFFTLTRALSLFATRRCILIHVEVKPAAAFLEALKEYLAARDPSLVLVVSSGRLAAATVQQKEFKALESDSDSAKQLNHLAIWPLDREQVPTFLIQHAKRYQLYLDLEVARRLGALTEGNLFAADQVLEKLSLSPQSNAKKVSQEDLDQITESQTRFELFDLVSAVLVGDAKRSWQIWTQLQAQKMEPILVLWALAKELRLLATLHEKMQEQGTANSLSELLKQHKFWEKRAREVSLALKRWSYAQCLSFLQCAAKIDRVLKGAEKGETSLLIGELLAKMAH